MGGDSIMNQNSTPFNVAAYDKQIKRTLPFYDEMVRQIIDIVKVLKIQSPRWLDVGCGTRKSSKGSTGQFRYTENGMY